MLSLLFTFALKEEARPFQKRVGSRSDLRILITGIGRANAEQAIRQALAERSPALVLTCGFAGALNPELAVGAVVFSVDEGLPSPIDPPLPAPGRGTDSTRPNYSSPPPEGSGVGSFRRDVKPQLDRLAAALVAANAQPATFHCADRVAASAEEKRALRQSNGADAVEMESGVIRAICARRNIPSATVRVISDVANEDLPLDFNRLMDAGRNLSYGRLAAALLRSPGQIGGLLRLQRQTQAAAENLAQVLMRVIEAGVGAEPD